jgi:hypothetical protein
MPYILIGPPPASSGGAPSGEETDAETGDQDSEDDAP